jgi:hypothetical protein
MTRRYDFQLGITHGIRFRMSSWQHEVDFSMDALPQNFREAAVVFYFHNPGIVASLRGSVGSAGLGHAFSGHVYAI